MTPTENRKRNIVIFIVTVVTLVIDQATKYYARSEWMGEDVKSYLGDTIRIQHAQNPGAFLSLGAGLEDSARFYIFTIAVAGFLLYITYGLFKNKTNTISTVALTAFIAGGIGNLIDRVVFGSVTDFLNFGIGPVRTGIFNVADMAIMGGLFALIGLAILERRQGVKA